jgi:hypothetical protein
MKTASECSGPAVASIRIEKPMTAFDAIAMTLDTAHAVATRLDNLRDRLIGPQPRAIESDTAGVPPMGLLADYESRARYAYERLSDALTAITQIERNLP